MKLHLPKMLLSAVLATVIAYGTVQAGNTGWDGNSLYIANGLTYGSHMNQNGMTGGSVVDGGIAFTEVDASTKGDIRIQADCDHDQSILLNIGKLTVGNNATVTVDRPYWGRRTFDTLTIDNLTVDGKANLQIEYIPHSGDQAIDQSKEASYVNKVVINQVTGSLGTVAVNSGGNLTIGADTTSTTNFSGELTNNGGSLTVNGAVVISDLAGFTVVDEGSVTWSDATKQQGYKTLSGATYQLSTGGVTYTDAKTVTYKGETQAIDSEDGTATFTLNTSTGSVYHIKDTTAITYDGSTGDTAAATGFDMADGTTLILNSSLAATATDGISLSGTSGATITLNGAGVTLKHADTVKTENGAKVSYNVNGGTLDINNEGTVSNISSINVNGGKATLSAWSANLGSADSYVDVLLSNDGAFTFKAGGAGGGNLYVNINVEGSGKLAGASFGNRVNIKGSVTGDGTLSLGQEYGNNVWWLSGAIKDAENGQLAISTENADFRVAITGENTYSGGTTMNGGKLIVGNSSALGTGKVTMNGGTLQMADEMDGNNVIQAGSDLEITSMDYKGGTVNIGEKKLTVTGKLTAAANMSIEGSGDTELGSLDLTAGTTLSTSGSLTIGELILDLEKYTDYTQTYNLVTVTGEGKSVTLTNPYTGSVNGYNYTVDGRGTNTLTLTFTQEPAQSDSLTTTVLEATLNGTMLTLKVDGNITSAEMTANITGFADGVLADILTLTKGVKDGLVGIKLVDDDQEYSIVGNGVDNVGFYGAYYGAGNGQYFVQYIPEPATATLSLLALAGLAARRRRK